MTIKVKATAPGFYGCLRDVGDEFNVVDEESLGNWMERLSGGETPLSQLGARSFAAARTGGGRFLVKDEKGQVVGDFTGSKAEAEAEAARLNAGGELNPAPASDTPPPGDDGQDDDAGPDA